MQTGILPEDREFDSRKFGICISKGSHMDISQEKGIYISISPKTGSYFLTEEDHVIVFLSEMTAKEKNMTVSGPKYLEKKELQILCRKAGAKVIELYDEKGDHEEINLSDYGNVQMNPGLTAAIYHLKETGRREYLNSFMKQLFLIPCKVEKGVEIYYEAAKIKESLYLLAFTDLDEFSLWASDSKWKPLEVTYEELIRIADRKQVVINIKSNNRYILTERKLSKISEAKRVFDEERARKKAEKQSQLPTP